MRVSPQQFPSIEDLRLCYKRYCRKRDISPDFDKMPSLTEILSDERLNDQQRAELKEWEAFFLDTDPESTAQLKLWYYYNLLRKGCIVLFSVKDLLDNLSSSVRIYTAYGRQRNITIRELHALSTSNSPDYKEFEIKKRSGGMRLISAPKARLRHIQRWILMYTLSNIEYKEYVTAFVRRRSIYDNCLPHVGAEIVVKLDLLDFFHSITFDRVLGIYLHLGYVYEVARKLAMFSCHKGKLPQGAPTSPALSNLACRKLDSRLAGLANKMGRQYTRYADDITLSGSGFSSRLIQTVSTILEEEGFKLATHKTRILHRGQSQRVTGLIVNEKVNIDRDYYRTLRAIIHNCQKFGIESQCAKHPVCKDGKTDFKAYLYGQAHYIRSINLYLGQQLLNQLEQINWTSQLEQKYEPAISDNFEMEDYWQSESFVSRSDNPSDVPF